MPIAPSPVPEKPPRFAAFRYRDFRLMWAGQLISGAGTQMQFVALNYQIYDLTGSPIYLGLTGLVRVVPIIIFSLLGGVIADNVDRRKLLLVTQTLMMLVAATLGALTNAQLITPLMIYALTAVGAAAVAFDSPARQSIAPNLVPREAFSNAVSLNTIAWQGANIAGPVLAGFVIQRFGIGQVYWVNAASFIASLAALALLHTRFAVAAKRNVSFGALKEGWKFVFSQPLVRVTMLLDFVATFFSSANQLLPVFAKDVLDVGAQGFGILSAASAVGAVSASVVMTFIPRLRHQGPLLLIAVGLYGFGTIIFGASHLFWLSFAALALLGAADIVSTVIRQTIRQLVTPDRLRGRMVSVNMVFFMGGPQLGELEAGLLAAAVGGPLSVVIGGIATIIITAWTAFASPSLRTYDEHPPEPPATPTVLDAPIVTAAQSAAGGSLTPGGQ